MEANRIGRLWPAPLVADAVGIRRVTLRAWAAGTNNLPALAFIGTHARADATWRRYSLAGAATVLLVARLTGQGDAPSAAIMGTSSAILVANVAAPHLDALEQAFAHAGADALVEMGAAAPVLIINPTGHTWPAAAAFEVTLYRTEQAYRARLLDHTPVAALHVAAAPLFTATAAALNRAAVARAAGEEPLE